MMQAPLPGRAKQGPTQAELEKDAESFMAFMGQHAALTGKGA